MVMSASTFASSAVVDAPSPPVAASCRLCSNASASMSSTETAAVTTGKRNISFAPDCLPSSLRERSKWVAIAPAGTRTRPKSTWSPRTTATMGHRLPPRSSTGRAGCSRACDVPKAVRNRLSISRREGIFVSAALKSLSCLLPTLESDSVACCATSPSLFFGDGRCTVTALRCRCSTVGNFRVKITRPDDILNTHRLRNVHAMAPALAVTE